MEASNSSTIVGQDERILAALAHLGILFQYFGVLVPIMIWLAYKDKSRYVAFQALQAMILQIILFLGLLVGMIGYVGSIFLVTFGSAFLQNSGELGPQELAIMVVPGGLFMAMMCVYGLFVIYGIVGGILCLFGKNFRYLIIGQLLARRWRPAAEAAQA